VLALVTTGATGATGAAGVAGSWLWSDSLVLTLNSGPRGH
jgi:hypothetical protein